MDVPECPPGAEGCKDSVTEVPKKPEVEESSCIKAEVEFEEHLNSLKIRLEDGETRCMVERRGRDISGKWIYLCYPCAAICSGESILQSHISGKKHKIKLSMRTVWPKSIFDYHRFNKTANKTVATKKVLQKMAEEVGHHNRNPSEFDKKYDKYQSFTCHIQEFLDAVKFPLIGVEYLIEHPPEEPHYEPRYICVLCAKQGQPRTIINHMTCFWHRYNYLVRHFPQACDMLTPYRGQPKYREGVLVILNRLSQRIEDKYGRKRPVNIEKEEYEKDKAQIHEWMFRRHHFSEKDGATFTEVIDIGLIESLLKSNEESQAKTLAKDKREPSPPIVAAPSRSLFNNISRPAGRQDGRAGSVESLSDNSDRQDSEQRRDLARDKTQSRDRHDTVNKGRFEPYDKRRGGSPFRHRHVPRSIVPQDKQQRPPNYEYKVKLADERRLAVIDSLQKTLAYHEKNPEKHPLYPEEWKKFWNKRYKEIQAEGKDPSKYDFKPEWIVCWKARMNELHEEELRTHVNEIYRQLCLSPPDMGKLSSEPRQSVDKKKEKHHANEQRRKSPELRRRSPDLRRRSPDRRRPDRYDRPDHRPREREPFPRRRSPPDFRRDRRSPPHRSPVRRRSLERRRSPPPHHHKSARSRSPLHRRSPARTHIALESIRRCSRSPLSQREQQCNRSPEHSSRQVAPSIQTVLISEDELKRDDGLSPWNSDNDIESVLSELDTRTDRSRAGSMVSRDSKIPRGRPVSGGHGPGQVLEGPADDVVATLRQLVALEDYLGSLGPKIVDLLAEALKMEKEKTNSSKELLERGTAVVLIETVKEKLKGAVQAGLVGGGAAQALRAAVVRAAATLHEADKRARLKQKQAAANPTKTTASPVAGVGEVNRAQIAQQMAEALIAQGKTDVSSEDLAVLVDAVVGVAEAKKRATEQTEKVIVPSPIAKPVIKPLPPKQSGTASALQMLQSAYDENDKNVVTERAMQITRAQTRAQPTPQVNPPARPPERSVDHIFVGTTKTTGQLQSSTPDAMDGLSDSDLKTLLKNFNVLSAEEQHNLIAYLKKLAAKEPERVERLRQYVSEAASTAPKEPTPENTEPEENPVKTVVVESDDDDDYTVEEVFQSATQKVKENQIRQEMEVLKKSFEETKAEAVLEPAKPENSLADITKSLSASSATDLFALVQATIKSTSAAPAPLSHSPNVVISNTQPRSFGDLPEPTVTQEQAKPPLSEPVTPAPLLNALNNQTQAPGSGLTPFQNLQGLLHGPVRFQSAQQQQQQQQNQQRPQQQQHQQQQQNYQAPPQSQQNYQSSQQNYASPSQQQQGYQPPPQNQQQNYQSPQANQQQNYEPPHQKQQQNYQPLHQKQQQPPFNQGQQQNYQPTPQHQQHKQGPQLNQMPPPHQQRNQPPHQQRNLPPQQQQYQPPQQQQYQPPQHQQQYQPPQQQHFNDSRNKPNDHFNQGQWNARPMENRPPLMRPTAPDNFGPNAPYNQGPRNNFMNGRGQDMRPQMNQQFYDNNQNNFRGRGVGRGDFSGPIGVVAEGTIKSVGG